MIGLAARDIAQMPQGNQVLGIECQRGFEYSARLGQLARLVQSLSVDDVTAHVTGLLREEFLADQDGLINVSRFAKFVGQRREVAPRIFVEFLLQLVDAGSTGHQSLGGGAQAGGMRGSKVSYTWYKSIRSARVT